LRNAWKKNSAIDKTFIVGRKRATNHKVVAREDSGEQGEPKKRNPIGPKVKRMIHFSDDEVVFHLATTALPASRSLTTSNRVDDDSDHDASLSAPVRAPPRLRPHRSSASRPEGMRDLTSDRGRGHDARAHSATSSRLEEAMSAPLSLQDEARSTP
jgi:hypothetical protein